MRFVLLVSIVGLVCTAAKGTTIIIRRTSDYIVIGADSLTVQDSSIPAGRHYRKTHSVSYTCKINQFGDTFFAHAGYSGESVVNLAKQAASQGRTIEQKAGIYNRLIKDQVEMEMEAIRQRLPDEFARLLGGRGTPF
jgi:hypothetical protein